MQLDAWLRKTAIRIEEKAIAGRLLTFMGAKGGTGVTTLACNFAVSLAQDPKQTTLLIDLDLPFGDVGVESGHHRGVFNNRCTAV